MRRTGWLSGFWLLALLVLPAPHALAQVEPGAFANPPAAARPHTWWHWMNGNITKEGITADLEAMAQIGLGGAQIFNVSESIPEGPIRFMSAEWLALVKHAATEAKRVGLELCIHNCAGWSSSGGPWITPPFAMQRVVTSEVHVTGPASFAELLPQPEVRCDFYRDIAVLAFPTPRDDAWRLPDWQAKAGYEPRYGLEPAPEGAPPDALVPRDRIVDLTSHCDAGRLTWDVPAGDWTIVRFGHTPTGKDNHPAPESGRGLECDKLSREAMDVHWAGMMEPVLETLGPLAGQTLDNALIDSYEVGHQNWTSRMREEFGQRRGYDPLPYLPALTGRAVESGEVTERFLWDLRRTIADLFADNYFGYFSELCHERELECSIEPYDGPFECLLAGRGADIPMGEFWVGSAGESSSCKLAASVAHIYGRKLVGAESFTADPDRGRWQNHPATLKAVGDLMYAAGINRFIVHRYAHQPWLDLEPGMTMGQWGTHFERTVTWWQQGAAWITYLTRCQYLLQQGRFAADVCRFAGEGAPSDAPHDPALKAAGYDYDALNADVILDRMEVRDGRLVLPDGMSYRVLVLPESTRMTPRLLAKLRALVSAGATVIGPRPDRSPSLADLGAGDAQVQKLAAEVWGAEPGQKHAITGRSAVDVLASLGVPPDCEFAGAAPRANIAWIHRIDGDTDLYFVANQKPRADDVTCTFRVSGKLPELWHPETGRIEPAPVWEERAGRISIPIHFDPAGSVFVVFRARALDADHVVALQPPVTARPPAPRIAIVRARYEAPDGAGGADVTGKVAELALAGEETIAADNALFGDPASMHVKRLSVEYTLDGIAHEKQADEGATLELLPPTPARAAEYTLARAGGELELTAFAPGRYEVRTAGGRSAEVQVPPLPAPVEIAGPWTLHFPPHRGAPPSITLSRLMSLSEHTDPGVRYFSGTAEYETTFELPAALLESGTVLRLDLGQVAVIAQVMLDGRPLGELWKPPYSVDITAAARAGKNTLSVRVTNLWVNRLIGDEQWPDDCQWKDKPLARWPEWLLQGKPRGTPERLTFTTWKHYTKDSPLVASGLIGPARVVAGRRLALTP